MFSDTPSPLLTNHTQVTHMQSFNQIAHSGDKWEEQGEEKKKKMKKKKKKKRTLNLWLTESCEGTLKSPPKSFKLGHVALAFVTLMLRNIADAAELEVREEMSQKCELLIAVSLRL